MTRCEIVMEENGLGPLPPAEVLSTTSSVLLFNSSKNPYREYSRENNLLGRDGVERESTAEGEESGRSRWRCTALRAMQRQQRWRH